jgi:hypothetical protein
MSKDIIDQQNEEETMDWEKTFDNHVCGKRLTYKIYKKIIEYDIKNTLAEKLAEDLNRNFPKEYMQITSRYMKNAPHY